MQFNHPVPSETNFYAPFENSSKDYSIYNTELEEFNGSTTFNISGALFNNSNYLATSGADFYNLKAKDYTIQFWLYLISANNFDTIFSKGQFAKLDNLYSLELNANAHLNYFIADSSQTYSTPVITSSSPILTGQWYHIAISRKGPETRLYLNGEEDSLFNEDYTIVTTGGFLEKFAIGAGIYSPILRAMNGFIRDFEVILDNGLYNKNFIPKNTQYDISNKIIFSSGLGNETIFTT